MPTDLERRLDAAGDRLPLPSEAIRRQARETALAALLSASGRPRARVRRRVRLAGVAVALLAAAALAVTLVTAFEGSSPFTTEKALAAIGDQPVVHAVVESEQPWATIVDLASGYERPQKQATEFWYDGERGLLRARATVDGRLVTELVQTREGGTSTGGPVLGPPREPQLDPALAGFATRYRSALEHGEARVVAETEIDGRDVVRLEISSESAERQREIREQIDVDADSYRPLRFRYVLDGNAAPWWRVVSVGTLPRVAGQFAPPPPGPVHPQAQTGSDERALTPAEAARALDRSALWPGRAVDGVELTTIEVMRLMTLWSDGQETEGRALRLEYGGGKLDRARRWLEIRQGTSRKERPRIGPDDPAVPGGQLQLFGLGDDDGSPVDWWVAYLEQDGVFLTLESSERDIVLAAARALRPIRER